MTGKVMLMVAALVVTISSLGCSKSTNETEAQAFIPASYPFEGKIKPQFVGNWKSKDSSTELDLHKNGKLNVITSTHSVAGKNVNHLNGKWLVNGNFLMLTYSVQNQKPIVLKYSASLTGKTLTLIQPGGKIKTKYLKL